METGIGKRIRERRKELEISQQDLANRMGLKSKSTICKIERGEDNLTLPIVKRYAKALNVDPFYLMGWTEPQDTPEAKSIRDAYANDTLSSDDRELLDLYHIASPEARAMVDFALKRITHNS